MNDNDGVNKMKTLKYIDWLAERNAKKKGGN